jgi:hypothetical protein
MRKVFFFAVSTAFAAKAFLGAIQDIKTLEPYFVNKGGKDFERCGGFAKWMSGGCSY